MTVPEHPVVAQVDPVDQHSARAQRAPHAVEGGDRVVEMLHDRAREDRVEGEAALGEEGLRRLAHVIGQPADGPLRRHAVEQPG